MPRRGYHQELLGTMLAMAGAVLVTGPVAELVSAPIYAAVIVVAIVAAGWLAQTCFRALTRGDLAIAGGLSLLVLRLIHDVATTSFDYRTALVVGAGVVGGFLASLVPPIASGFLTRALVGGLIAQPLGLLCIRVGAATDLGTVRGVVAGALLGPIVAVLFVPLVRVRELVIGCPLILMSSLYVILTREDAQSNTVWGVLMATGIFSVLFTALGGWVGTLIRKRMPARTEPIPEAREVDR